MGESIKSAISLKISFAISISGEPTSASNHL